MRRLALTALAIAAAAALLVTTSFADGEGGEYKVRAPFDSADFLVEGMELRIAGANVGTIDELDVSRPDETVARGDEPVQPGKALVIMNVEEEGFTNFREDASCRIRPQSLLGEKYVECLPTQPRAAGSEPPPLIEPIPEGERGEGQYLVPLENNSRAVDLDIVNNIMREPEVDRFRLILNEFGAALAARGEDLAEVIRRANPALQETDRVLAILAAQNRQLADLARDSDTVLEPLAEQRASVRGFIAEAGTTAQATAERREDLEAGLARMPRFMRELRPTMAELERFAEAGVPLARDLREAAPSLTGATRQLERFAPPATDAMVSLGDAAEQSGGPLAASDPVIRQIGKLARTTAPGAESLAELLRSLRTTGGVDQLMHFLFNAGAGFNGFDEFGHYMRAQLLVTNCVDYVITPITGCNAKFSGERSPTRTPSRSELAELLEELRDADAAAEDDAAREPQPRSAEPPAPAEPERAPDAQGEEAESGEQSAEPEARARNLKMLLEYLTEDGS
jgi:phospholipid/cholesterol/gamma-HCH transport system substrate-binding protein